MPFIPHTDADIKEMLETIGISKIETLFDEIPPSLRHAPLDEIPAALPEMELNKLMQARAQMDTQTLSFLGAGAYEHHIPAAVWEVATRGEFYTAYTPYQAEASQGSLQLIYEFQTMIARLTALEVANASLYDGASALAEAILMAVRLQSKKQQTQILMPSSVHPHYRETVRAIVSQQDIQLIDVPYDKHTGQIDQPALDNLWNEQVAAFVIPQPNFFGVLEEVNVLNDWARAKGILSIAVVNPTAMALLQPPGLWGEQGVDMACGEGQPLGIPLASGGPYYGFLSCKKTHVRQMPGRIVGKTVDADGKPGYVLTLQAREQHIRRGKATSNICTNQGLMVTASTIYMSLLGPEGLRQVAVCSHERTRELQQALVNIPGVRKIFSGVFFHEIVLQFEHDLEDILKGLAKAGIQAGYNLQLTYPELKNCLLLCATETKSVADIQYFTQKLRDILGNTQFKGGKLACQN